MRIPSALEYDSAIEPHRRALRLLALEFDFFLRDIGNLDVFAVTVRTKDYRSAVAKSAELKIPIYDLDDLAGLRVVVGTLSEVPVVERFFTRQQDGKDLQILKSQKVARKDGYRATHLVVERKSHYQTSVMPGRVEVQVNTIFEHAFNYLSRNWSYKQPWNPSASWSKSFSKLSQLLEQIEQAATELHTEVASTQSAAGSASLTPYSYQQLVKTEFGEDIDITECVDACRMYTGLGFKNNENVLVLFRDQRVHELYQRIRTRGREQESPNPLFEMSKSSFWGIFGIRIGSPGLKEFFASLRADA